MISKICFWDINSNSLPSLSFFTEITSETNFTEAKISFLISIPTLIAVSLFGVKNLITNENLAISNLNLISILFSFLFSYITIKFFLGYIKNFNLNLFVFYRIILGLVLLTIAYL